MWPSLAVALLLLGAVTAKPAQKTTPSKEVSRSKIGQKTGSAPVIRRIPNGIMPYPQAVDDLQFFPYSGFFIVTGSRFISIEPDNTCWRCEFNEDFNHCIQINQTLCNETIQAGQCPDSVSKLYCTEITGSKAGPIYVQVVPFKKTRAKCYVRKGTLRLQPVYDSQIFILQPKIESCNFAIASPLPVKYTQYP